MDATRSRRTRDRARQGWYARYRQWRFARYLGFVDGIEPPAARPEESHPVRFDRSAIGMRPAAGLFEGDSAVVPRLREGRAMATAAR